MLLSIPTMTESVDPNPNLQLRSVQMSATATNRSTSITLGPRHLYSEKVLVHLLQGLRCAKLVPTQPKFPSSLSVFFQFSCDLDVLSPHCWLNPTIPTWLNLQPHSSAPLCLLLLDPHH